MRMITPHCSAPERCIRSHSLAGRACETRRAITLAPKLLGHANGERASTNCRSPSYEITVHQPSSLVGATERTGIAIVTQKTPRTHTAAGIVVMSLIGILNSRCCSDRTFGVEHQYCSSLCATRKQIAGIIINPKRVWTHPQRGQELNSQVGRTHAVIVSVQMLVTSSVEPPESKAIRWPHSSRSR